MVAGSTRSSRSRALWLYHVDEHELLLMGRLGVSSSEMVESFDTDLAIPAPGVRAKGAARRMDVECMDETIRSVWRDAWSLLGYHYYLGRSSRLWWRGVY